MLIFENFVKNNRKEFVAKVKDIANFLQVEPNWLMAIMYNESTLDPSIVNSIGATGLIQFLPSTAISLGTTVEELRNMSNIVQLEFVKKYFAPYRGKINSWMDLYLATFYPRALGENSNFVIGGEVSQSRAELIAKQNKFFDLNNDGVITVADFKLSLQKRFKDMKGIIADKLVEAKKFSIKNPALSVGALLVLIYIGVKTTSRIIKS